MQKNVYNLNPGDALTGSYHGVKFAGRLRSQRVHSMNWKQMLYIDLDTPITVFGSERNDVLLKVDETGRDVDRRDLIGHIDL